MRLATIRTAPGATTAALVRDDIAFGLRDGGGNPVPDVGALLDAGADLRTGLGDGVTTGDRLGHIDEVDLAPPVLRPGQILCAGMNYLDHVLEVGGEVPDRPLVFAKLPGALAGARDDIRVPRHITDQVDHEVELAAVIGRPARHVEVERALDHVAGYTVVNDVTARDWQFGQEQLTLGKGLDTFLPCGPWLTTADEIADPHDLGLQCWVDDDCVQDSSTSQLILGVAGLISWLSGVCTLRPGDLIATGTPPGVGFGATPRRFLQGGQLVRCRIDGLGELRNRVRPD